MKKLFFLFALPLLAQNPVITITPLTNSSGTKTAPGILNYQDLSGNILTVTIPSTLSGGSYTITFPTAPGTGCLMDNGSGTWSVGSCSGSGIPTDMMTTDTAQNVTGVKNWQANITFGTDNTYSIGTSATRPANIYSNFIESPDYRVDYRSAGTVVDYFDIKGQSSHTFGIYDSSSNEIFEYTNTISPFFIFTGVLEPNGDATYDLGASSFRWRNLYISGTCGNCTPSDMMTTDTNQTVSGVKTLSANLLVTTNNVYSLGTISSRFANVYSMFVESPDYRIDYISGGTLVDYYDFVSNSANVLTLKDSSNNDIFQYTNQISPFFIFTGTLEPNGTLTYDLGASSFVWNNLYVNTIHAAACTGAGCGGNYTQGLGVSIAGSVISIGQSVATNASPTFGTILPFANNTYNLGSAGDEYAAAYINVLHVTSCVGCGGGTTFWTLSGTTLSPSGNYSISTQAANTSITAGANLIALGNIIDGIYTVINSSGNFIGNQVLPSVTGLNIAFATPSNQIEILGNGSIYSSGSLSFQTTGQIELLASLTSIGSQSGSYTTQIFLGNQGFVVVPLYSGSTILPTTCTGLPSPWFGFSQDGYLIVCANGVRSRAKLTTY